MKDSLPKLDAPPAPVSYDSVAAAYSYDPEKGKLVRLTKRLRGTLVTTAKIKVDGVAYSSKTIAWFLYNKTWPTYGIRPINGNECDFRLANLVLANRSAPPAPHITRDRLKELVSYDPETGEFKRKTYGGTGYPVGSVMNRPHQKKDLSGNPTGPFLLIRFKLDNRMYCAHHLAVLYVTGKWPRYGVKHINGQQEDLRWSNLYFRE